MREYKPMTLTAVTDWVKPRLNFLRHSMSDAVKLNTPRGGGPASACSQPYQTRSRTSDAAHMLWRLRVLRPDITGPMGVVWHTGPTPLIYPYWNLQALLRKVLSDVTWFAAHVCGSAPWSSSRSTTERIYDRTRSHIVTFCWAESSGTS